MNPVAIADELQQQREIFAVRCLELAQEIARLNGVVARQEARIAELSKPAAEPDPQS